MSKNLPLVIYHEFKTFNNIDFRCGGAENAAWAPSKVVPDCVSEDTTLSTYDIVATINYKSNAGAIGAECEGDYLNFVQQYYESIGEVFTERCSAGSGSINIQVSTLNTTLILIPGRCWPLHLV